MHTSFQEQYKNSGSTPLESGLGDMSNKEIEMTYDGKAKILRIQ